MRVSVAIIILVFILVVGGVWYLRHNKQYTHADAVVYMTIALLELKRRRQVMHGRMVAMPTLYSVADLQKWMSQVYPNIDVYTPAWSRALSVFMYTCQVRKPVPQQLGEILLLAEYVSSITPDATEITVRQVYYEALYGEE